MAKRKRPAERQGNPESQETPCVNSTPEGFEPVIRPGYLQFIGMLNGKAFVTKDSDGGGIMKITVFDEGGGPAALAMAMTLSNRPLKITIEEV